MERSDFEQVNGKVVASSRLRGGYGEFMGDVYQVLTFRNGRIVEIRGCRSRREAMRVARSH